MYGVELVSAGYNRNFDACVIWQICYEPLVRDIAVEFKKISAQPCVDDERGIFMTALDVDFRLGEPFLYVLLPFLVLAAFRILVEYVRVMSGIPVCAACAVFLDEVGTFAEPGAVLGVVPA